MLMNFSPMSMPLPEVYLTFDETEILVQCQKADKEYLLCGGKVNATLCKSELLRTDATVPTT